MWFQVLYVDSESDIAVFMLLDKLQESGKYFSYSSIKNICYGYSLEVPCWGTSNEYHNHNAYVELWPTAIIWQRSREMQEVYFNSSLAEHDMSCLSKQCRSRSVGFWRSQLIWICTVCHLICEFLSKIQIK